MEGARMYFVALVLPAELDKIILGYKQAMAERYGCKVGLKSPAHITLVPPFWLAEEWEPVLRRDMETLAATAKPFAVQTQNFSRFGHRTLFVAVAENESLQALKSTVDAFFAKAPYPVKRDGRPFHPHITIATRDLHKKDFAAAWADFEHKPFAEWFTADALSLLRHNGRSWEVVQRSVLGAQGVG